MLAEKNGGELCQKGRKWSDTLKIEQRWRKAYNSCIFFSLLIEILLNFFPR